MKIKNPNTQNTWEIDLEPELLNRISEINIDSPNDITITFHDNSHPKSNTSILKKILDFIKEWRWLIGLIGGSTLTITGIKSLFASVSHMHVIVLLIIVGLTLFLCIKFGWKK